MGRTKRAFLGTISSQIYAVTLIIVSISSTPIIVRTLDAEIYGLSVIIFQITAYVGIFDFGLTAGASRFLAGTKEESEENRSIINRIVFTSFVVYSAIALGIIAVSSIFFLLPFTSGLFNTSPEASAGPVLLIIICLVSVQIVIRALSGIFFAHQRQLLANTISFVLSLANMIGAVVFVSLGYSLWSFVYSQAIVLSLNIALNAYFFNRYYSYVKFESRYYDYKLLKELFSYGVALFVITLATQLIFHTDRILLGSFISLTAVSIYSITTRIPELVTQLLWQITDNAFPAMVESLKKDRASFLRIHDELMNITMSLATVCFWAILLFSYPFIKLWVGSEYYAGMWFLMFMTYLYLVQHTFIHVTSMCLSAAGEVKQISRIYIVEAMLNVALSILLIRKFEMLGVVYGTILAGLLTSVWFTPRIAIRYMGSSSGAYVLSIVKPLALNSIVGLSLYVLLINFFGTIDNFFGLAAAALVSVPLMLLPFLLTNRNLILTLMKSFKKA